MLIRINSELHIMVLEEGVIPKVVIVFGLSSDNKKYNHLCCRLLVQRKWIIHMCGVSTLLKPLFPSYSYWKLLLLMAIISEKTQGPTCIASLVQVFMMRYLVLIYALSCLFCRTRLACVISITTKISIPRGLIPPKLRQWTQECASEFMSRSYWACSLRSPLETPPCKLLFQRAKYVKSQLFCCWYNIDWINTYGYALAGKRFSSNS
jgi:hypothetical protein